MIEPPPLQIITERVRVPNIQPITPPDGYRLAIIGEAPGEDEEKHHYPFVGKSGGLLNIILGDAGIDRHKCFVGNICQVRPPGNEISRFSWDGPEIQSGLTQLTHDLEKFQPHICILLGGSALHAARPQSKITAWRGSLFRSNTVGPFWNKKCIASLHPAFVLREYQNLPLLQFDVKRALHYAADDILVRPQRELITNLPAADLCYLMDTWPAGLRCSVDIEGGLPIDMVHPDEIKRNAKKPKDERRTYGWPCVSISARPSRSFTIAWGRMGEEEHCRVLRSFARLMGRRDVPKVLQNQLYDNFVLSYGYGIPIRNVTEDIMIKGWEIFAELPRSLAVQASIWTEEPHWKDDSMYNSSGEGLFRGCGLDSAVTIEICEQQDAVLTDSSIIHYRRMIEIQNPFLYMELKGIRYDQENAKRMYREVVEGTADREGLNQIRERLCQLTGQDLCGAGGSLSSTRLKNYLYGPGGYPPQYKKENGRLTDKLTTDIEALLKLKRHRQDDQLLSDILRHRHLEGVRETLAILPDPDGRVRCGYSLEAETGRVKCYTSPTGSGANLQTIQKSLRYNYLPDPGYDFAQYDLEGADGWTVAARAKSLGDPTMWDDYAAGMKPAKIIALLYWFGQEINRMERSDVKWLHDHVFPIVKSLAGEWLYLGCKRVQHGSSYLMGIPTMCLNILKDSFKESGTPIYLEQSIARALQEQGMFARYPGVRTWQNWAESYLVAHGELVSASGHRRVFFGRRFGDGLHDTLKEFLAHEPQNNTTWATNLAMLNLWNDPENRRPDGSLIIEPLHQVHDALCVQWPSGLRAWATGKMRDYFRNTLNIAGQEVIIPFDGGWGTSWGDTKNPV